jgi:hypothetical protein
MVLKDSKEKLKDILRDMGITFADADDLIEKSKNTVKKSKEVE